MKGKERKIAGIIERYFPNPKIKEVRFYSFAW
jgi:hypothetical protein